MALASSCSGVNTPIPKIPIGICGIDGFSLAIFGA